MDELTIGDKIYISSKQAAKITGYAKDYVGQLCREGRVEAKLVGRNWYVLESSIREHRFGPESKPEPITEAHQPAPEPVTRAWEAPTYVSVEPEALIPAVKAPEKPELTTDSSEAVVLMQDAWKEWFAAREQAGQYQTAPEVPVQQPEVQEMEVEETPIEEVRASDIPSIYNVSEVSHIEEDEGSAVPITRVEEEYVEPYVPPVPVHIARPNVSAYSESRNVGTVVDLSHAYEERYEPQEPIQRLRRGRVQRKRKGTLTIQALLLSIAGLTIVLAVIGSGALDSLPSTKGINDSLRGTIFDTLRGETRMEK